MDATTTADIEQHERDAVVGRPFPTGRYLDDGTAGERKTQDQKEYIVSQNRNGTQADWVLRSNRTARERTKCQGKTVQSSGQAARVRDPLQSSPRFDLTDDQQATIWHNIFVKELYCSSGTPIVFELYQSPCSGSRRSVSAVHVPPAP